MHVNQPENYEQISYLNLLKQSATNAYFMVYTVDTRMQNCPNHYCSACGSYHHRYLNNIACICRFVYHWRDEDFRIPTQFEFYVFQPGSCFNIKIVSSGMWFPLFKKRGPWDRLIVIMVSLYWWNVFILTPSSLPLIHAQMSVKQASKWGPWISASH